MQGRVRVQSCSVQERARVPAEMQVQVQVYAQTPAETQASAQHGFGTVAMRSDESGRGQTRSYERRGGAAMGDKADLLQGTLDLLILRTLLLGPLHGWGIAKRIEQLSGEVLSIGQGSLYPALYRLEDRGWVTSEWGRSPEGRRAKFYTLTPAGRRRLQEEEASWRLFVGAVEQVLQAT